MDHDISATEPSSLVFSHQRRVVAGLADDAVETVSDLRPRGRAEEIEAALRETHLPALEEAGYIEWDRETGEIMPGPNFSEAADHVSDLPSPVPESETEASDD
ncbi:hypothetical protein [Halorubrum sp. F4]|uniref:DUF7344 domain-containing protein n=1 Tax=Halorubrum sp. F4 TaxID=2989715 RepID=UPI002481002A|nr:hypothetical protein [Halorubrum sp. F4]